MSRIEAIVIHKNRRPTVVKLRKNQTHFKLNEKEYHVDPEATVFGRHWPWYKFKLSHSECNRYYFPEDSVKPIRFHEVLKKSRNGKDGQDNQLITPGELHQIFNPRFYQIIAKAGKNAKQDFMLYAAIAAAAISGYNAWQLSKIIQFLGM